MLDSFVTAAIGEMTDHCVGAILRAIHYHLHLFTVVADLRLSEITPVKD